jgi:hypothetical protein
MDNLNKPNTELTSSAITRLSGRGLAFTDPDKKKPSEYLIRGFVFREDGSRLAGGEVAVFDKDLRAEARLGGAKTASDGSYEVRFDVAGVVADNKRSPNLLLKITDVNGNALPSPDVVYRAATVTVINVGKEGPGPSEFERLTTTLMPLLKGVKPEELSLSQISVSVLPGPRRVRLQVGRSAATVLPLSIKLRPEDLLARAQPDLIKHPLRLFSASTCAACRNGNFRSGWRKRN